MVGRSAHRRSGIRAERYKSGRKRSGWVCSVIGTHGAGGNGDSSSDNACSSPTGKVTAHSRYLAQMRRVSGPPQRPSRVWRGRGPYPHQVVTKVAALAAPGRVGLRHATSAPRASEKKDGHGRQLPTRDGPLCRRTADGLETEERCGTVPPVSARPSSALLSHSGGRRSNGLRESDAGRPDTGASGR